MQIIGYIGYAILIFLAVTWAIGVRTKLGAGLFTIVGIYSDAGCCNTVGSIRNKQTPFLVASAVRVCRR